MVSGLSHAQAMTTQSGMTKIAICEEEPTAMPMAIAAF